MAAPPLWRSGDVVVLYAELAALERAGVDRFAAACALGIAPEEAERIATAIEPALERDPLLAQRVQALVRNAA